ncbi:MAG: response regulator transcription factor [Gammaproteobacteria bacterium]|nr:response regulator transcription factor [Gammaproteobacteria bacterium]
MWILLVEDNDALAANIGEYLEQEGDIVDFAHDGLSGLRLAEANAYDALVLDLMLPGLDGLQLATQLRANSSRRTPILMLTARDTLKDKLDGFEAGGDDYLTKPFDLLELRARLKALVRRAGGGNRVLALGDLVYDTGTLAVRRGAAPVKLTRTGLRMLELLMRRAPEVVSRQEMERAIWGDEPPDSDAALRVHVHGLRVALDRPFDIKLLHTVPGIGYRLAPHGEV